ncbi:MAG: tyrosine-type recombinase/integrase, partial [Vicinamibacterales bacterium]
VTLAKARDLARAALRASTVGRDPGAEQQQARVRTFGALTALYLEQHAKRKKKSWRADARIIRQELVAWRDRPVAGLRRADVRDRLESIVDRGAPVLANRVLALVRKILNFALDREWIEANVATKMARPTAEQSRSRVLTEDELRTVWAWLERPAPEDADGTHWTLAQAALKVRLVTAQRGGEVINMRWEDIDEGTAWWTIPAGHSKNKLAHRVPLTPMALAIIRSLRGADATHVFAGIRGARHRRGVLDGLPIADVRPHDFRRTAASLLAAGGIPRLTISKVLNHVETGVTAIYDRHSYDAEKRVALEAWARRLRAIVSEQSDGHVVAFVNA